MRLLALTKQLTHYHEPRFDSLGNALGNLTIVSVAGEGKQPEVLSSVRRGNYFLVDLYSCREEYEASIKIGKIFEDLFVL